MQKKKTLMNLLAAMVAFSANILINFFLSPYIITRVGVEAYGFFYLANNFIMYISLVTLAVNSMSSRFITIAMHEGKAIEAREYYASVLAANVLMAVVLALIGVAVIWQLDFFLQIPNDIVIDVKLLFLAVLVNFILDLCGAVLSVCYMVRNQLYTSSVVQIKSNLLRMGTLLVLFYFFPPHIAYMGVGALLAQTLAKFYDYQNKRRLLPELFFRRQYVRLQRVKEMIASGIWNTILRLGNILSGNLDLLLVNLYLDATSMGVLSISKMIPNMLFTISGTLSGVFMPAFLELYAKKEMEQMKAELHYAMKVFSLLLSLPLVSLMSIGDVFFQLWLPNQDAEQLYLLSNLSLLAIAVIGPVAIMHNIFVVVNRIKTNSLLIVLTGALNTLFGWFILKYTTLGLPALVLLTSGLSLIRNLLYTVPYGAMYLGYRWQTFFPVLLKALCCIACIVIPGLCLKYLCPLTSWPMFILAVVFLSMLDVAIHLLLIFNKKERTSLLQKLQGKLLRLKGTI